MYLCSSAILKSLAADWSGRCSIPNDDLRRIPLGIVEVVENGDLADDGALNSQKLFRQRRSAQK